jgi:hypothetical protein
MLTNELIWLAVAAILIGLGLVAISLALRGGRADGAAAKDDRADEPLQGREGGAFIDQPLTMDLHAALGVTAPADEREPAVAEAVDLPAVPAPVGSGPSADAVPPAVDAAPPTVDMADVSEGEDSALDQPGVDDDTLEGLAALTFEEADHAAGGALPEDHVPGEGEAGAVRPAAGRRTRVKASPPKRPGRTPVEPAKPSKRRSGPFPPRRGR